MGALDRVPGAVRGSARPATRAAAVGPGAAPSVAFTLIAAALSVSCRGTIDAMPAVSVAFETSRSQILLPVQIGGGTDPLWFILDSGVDPSVIDDSLLELDPVELLGAESGKAQGAGDGEGLDVRLAAVHRYSIGGLGFSELEAVAADLSGFGEKLGRPLAGILGYSFLKDKVVRIDYAASRVDLAMNSGSLPDRGSPSRRYSVPLRFMTDEDLIPVVDLSVNDQVIRVTVDTGSSLGIQIYASAVDRLGLAALREQAAPSSISGARGQAQVHNATLDRLVLGPFEEADVPISFSDRPHDPDQRQGNAGNRLLERFVLTLDYVGGAIVFEQ